MGNASSADHVSFYSLKKSRGILQSGNSWYKKNWKKLPKDRLEALENSLERLDQALLAANQSEADKWARELELFAKEHVTKSIKDYAFEILIALVLALAIATVVRQTWFELYEIPTGSMRPTFKEKDRLIVTKTAFGINAPLATKHLYFDPSLVERTGVVIFSGDNLDMFDVDSTYFWVFPYKKRYIKRLIAKPGDALYFYGGEIYGIDGDGNDLTVLRDSPWMRKLAHIPYSSFEGRLSYSPSNNQETTGQFFFKQMNTPIAKISFSSSTGETSKGQIFDGKQWIDEDPLAAAAAPHEQVKTLGDLWGIKNYAMARLLTKEQVAALSDINSKTLEEGVLYLELRHSPSVTAPKPRLYRHSQGGISPFITPQVTFLPLQKEHIDAIMNNIYTARFVVKNGKAQRYSVEGSRYSETQSPAFSDVPDGTYEFYYGKAQQVGWGGTTSELPADHPLYSRDPSHVQKLFNLGIEMMNIFEPYAAEQTTYPSRYAYFRNGDLYLLDAPAIKKDDPALIAFNENELKREKQPTPKNSYIAFKDYGAPIKDGKIDKDFIKTFGLTIPAGMYLALGDNHAMSADSRYFGFVPEDNIQGAPTIILWPFGERWGAPDQHPYPLTNLPGFIVWAVVLIIALSWYAIHRYRISRPQFKRLSK